MLHFFNHVQAVAFVVVFVLSSFAVSVLQAEQQVLISDRETDQAEAVAREILQIQEQLGGSVVSDRPQLQGFRRLDQLTPTQPQAPMQQNVAQPDWVAQGPMGQRSPRTSKVAELREAAWQLETTAHRLEHLDLYDQADALRAVATRLRGDARTMKRAETAAVGTRAK